MVRNRPPLLAVILFSLFFTTSSIANGQVWHFLGFAQIDGSREHSDIQVGRRDHAFRTIQIRLTGGAVFFDHLVLHYSNGTDQTVMINGRISPAQKEQVIDLSEDGRLLDTVEFFYFKEPWERTPKVTLYGLRVMSADSEFLAPER